jgi:hypothetical protein
LRAVEFDAAEFAASHAGDAVVLGQTLIEVSEAAVQKIEDAAVFADNGGEEEFGFGAHGFAQAGVELGKLLRVRFEDVEVAELQPLAPEIVDQGVGPWVVEQALHLRVEDVGDVQAILKGESGQFVVGHAAP